MSFQGPLPIGVPLAPAQIRAAGDQLYARLDKANQQQHVFPNALMNASFDWWQRGTSFSGTGLGADRWPIYTTTGTITKTQQTFGLGDIASESTYFARVSISGHTAGSDLATFYQNIEGVRKFAGRRVVVRGMARRSSGAGNMYVEFTQNFGSGGSAQVIVPGSQVALSSIWAPFSVIIDVPTLAGKVIGTGAEMLQLNFWLSAGANYNARTGNLGLQTIGVDFADVEVKEIKPGYGDVVPGFERVPKDLDLLRCLRFFERSWQLGDTLGLNVGGVFGNAHPTANFRLPIKFTVPKRIIPSLIIYDANGQNPGTLSNYNTSSGWLHGQSVQISNTAIYGFYVGHNNANTVETQGQYVATAEY